VWSTDVVSPVAGDPVFAEIVHHDEQYVRLDLCLARDRE